MNTIKSLNIIWVLSSLFYLWLAANNGPNVVMIAMLVIVIQWLVFYGIGQREQQKDIIAQLLMIGEKAKGQWER